MTLALRLTLALTAVSLCRADPAPASAGADTPPSAPAPTSPVPALPAPVPAAPAAAEPTVSAPAQPQVATVRPIVHVTQRSTANPVKEPSSPLDQVTPVYRPDHLKLEPALRLLGRPFGVTFVVDPDAAETVVTLDMRDATLRDCLTAIVETKGLYYEERSGYVTVRRNKTEFYFIEYPSMKRKTNGSVNINLSASQNNNNSNSSNMGGNRGSLTGGAGNAQGNQMAQQDQSSLSITRENDLDVWAVVEKQLRSLLREGETLDLNRSGMAAITASVERHRDTIKPYVAMVNRRINRQVHIKAQIIEVDVSSSNKLGVNWTQAATKLGNSAITFSGSTSTNLTNAGPIALGSDSFTARIGIGKLDGVLSALSEQGTVNSESNPSVTTLVNQTVYIKLGDDRTFFTLDSSTSISQPTASTGTSTAREDVYRQFSQTFGDVLEVTPSVSEEDIITLVVSPTISRFIGLTTSPDGRLSGPNANSKATESIIRLRSGESGVMGGFIFTQSANDKKGVPYIEKVPLLGRLFRTDTKAVHRTELAIFITATLDDL